jgi:hypothetical protein
MGYSSLNGGSRPALSALRKFGLIEYLGSGADAKARLTELAKQIILPTSEDERREAIWRALHNPEIYKELALAYPEFAVPSDVTFRNILVREHGLQEGAVKAFIASLYDSINFARSHGTVIANLESASQPDLAPVNETIRSSRVQAASVEISLLRISMPNSATYLMVPEMLSYEEGRRVLKWFERVVKPAIQFAAGIEAADE